MIASRILRPLLLVLGVLSLSIVTVASAQAKDTVTIGIGAEPLTLLGTQVVDWTTAAQLENIYDSLFTRDRDTLQVVPWLATGYEIIDDNTWDITLRDDVTFHNGEAFNAEAVKFTLDYMLDEENESMWRPRFSRIEGVEVLEPTKVRITTSEPFPALIDRLAGTDVQILAPGYVQEVGLEEAARNPVGTGPYKFVRWDRGEQLVLERNPDYWAGPAEIENVVFKVIPEFGSRLSALLADEIDVMKDVPPQTIQVIERSPGVELRSVVSSRINYIAFQTLEEGLLQDVNVRRALTHAIDVDELITAVLQGNATRICSYTSSTDPSYNEAIECSTYDLEEARALFAEAGVEPEGLSLTLDTPSGRYPLDKEVSEAIAAQLSRLGIDVQVQVNEWRNHLDKIVNRQTGDMYYLGWGPILEPSSVIPELFRDDRSYASFGSPETDSAVEAALTIVDPAERDAAFKDIQVMLAEDAPWMPLWQQHDLYAVATWLDWSPRADEKLWMWEAKASE